MIKKLIATGTGIAAVALSALPAYACGCGCGMGGAITACGWPAVGCQFAPLSSLYGLGMMLPSWGWGWGWW